MTVSRYQSVGTAVSVSRTGENIRYLRRRFLPVVDDSTPTRPHRVAIGELNRPDLVAAAELGQAELSWVLADSNSVMRPSELCQRTGQLVRVPLSLGMNVGTINGQ